MSMGVWILNQTLALDGGLNHLGTNKDQKGGSCLSLNIHTANEVRQGPHCDAILQDPSVCHPHYKSGVAPLNSGRRQRNHSGSGLRARESQETVMGHEGCRKESKVDA